MLETLNSVGSELYSGLIGYILGKVYDFFYPDALILYTRNFCKRKPRELDPTKKLPQLWEERFIDDDNNHRHDCAYPLGYKNYKYANIKDSKWIVKVDRKAVSQNTKIHIYNTISTHPDTGYNYFYFRIKYYDTDSPEIIPYNRLFYRGDNKKIVDTIPFKNIESITNGNTICGSLCFKSNVGETRDGREIGTEQIGFIFGTGPGEYIIEEAYISDKQINIKKCWCTYIFWRCYTKKPKYITKEP
jgi:hypothetical protein